MAERVTHKEKVLDILKKRGDALQAREIARIGGINYNTVRGSLNALRREGKVERVESDGRLVAYRAK